jgi:hypothetical protein
MIENELIYDIKELVKSHKLSDDIDLSNRYISYLLSNQRALWIRKKYSEPGNLVNDSITQTLGAMELEVADRSICPGIPAGCSILRTKEEIPNPVTVKGSELITRVGPVDILNYDFSYVPYERAIYTGNGKYNQQQVFAFLLDNRIYIKTANVQYKMLKYINIRGVFEDPSIVTKYCDAQGNTCYDPATTNYPIERWMIPFVKEQVVNQLVQSAQMPKDQANNANNNNTDR